MVNVVIRPGVIEDFDQCQALDHRYFTKRVWQLAFSPGETAQAIRFQSVRLPRPLTAPYPYPSEELVERWCRAEAFFVAEENGRAIGYLTLSIDPFDSVAWLLDLVVSPRDRRQGVGSNLLAAGQHWALNQRIKRLLARVETKNDPAICFLKKNGLLFCGYNEYQFQGENIALYFTMRIL